MMNYASAPNAALGMVAALILAVAAPASAFAPNHLGRAGTLCTRHVVLRHAQPVASFAMNPPEFQRLKDSLMEHTIHTQLHRFSLVNDRGLQLWLKSAWDKFYQGCQVTSGDSSNFLDELCSSDRQTYFVPTRGMQQGSKNNPFLADRKTGYNCQVEPSKIVLRLMECRKELAEEWRKELEGFASGNDSGEKLIVRQLLAGLVTRVALRQMLHDLSLLPSQKDLHGFLSTYMMENIMCFEPGGDVEKMLSELEAQPIRIRGKALVDPPQIAEEVRTRRQAIASKMAQVLDDAEDEHHMVFTSFLQRCFDYEPSEQESFLERCFSAE